MLYYYLLQFIHGFKTITINGGRKGRPVLRRLDVKRGDTRSCDEGQGTQLGNTSASIAVLPHENGSVWASTEEATARNSSGKRRLEMPLEVPANQNVSSSASTPAFEV